MTLLVLDLVVPVLSPGATSVDLLRALSKEYVSFLSYLFSFFIAGLWWSAHNRNFSHIRNSDSTLGWLNLLFLLWIALLPFFTKILDQYNTVQLAVVLYAISQAAAGIFMSLLWWYASKNHHLVDRNLKKSTIRNRLLANTVTPLFFIISIGVSFLSPVIATLFWFTMFPVIMIVHRLERKNK